MLPLRALTFFNQSKFSTKKLLYLTSLMLFFWALFDGIISYVTPLIITEKGLSKTAMGLIYSSSSIAGAIFDFLLAKFLKNTHYRRLFGLMFIICFAYPLILGQAKTITVFLLAMSLWGFYYDLINFGLFDFLSRWSKPEGHSAAFGVVGVFKSLGYLLSPLIAGLTIGALVGQRPFWLAFFFLLIAFSFYLLLNLNRQARTTIPVEPKIHRRINLLAEFHLWEKIGRTLLPVLLFTMVIFMVDAFFWTIGPLYSEMFPNFKNFGGLFMTMFELPVLLTGWFVGKINTGYGKKKTAFVSLLISSIFLLGLPFLSNPWLILILILIASFFSSLAWPSIKGAFVDYITEAYKYEKEIEGLNDFFTNLGYIIGPILAGFLADYLGNSQAFAVLGIIGIMTSLYLLLTTPKQIQVVVK